MKKQLTQLAWLPNPISRQSIYVICLLGRAHTSSKLQIRCRQGTLDIDQSYECTQCMSWSTWRWYKQTQLNNFDTLPFWLWTVLHSNFRKPMLSFHYLASHNVVIKICEFQQFLTVNCHIITRDYNCLLVAIHLPDDGLIGIWLHLFCHFITILIHQRWQLTVSGCRPGCHYWSKHFKCKWLQAHIT